MNASERLRELAAQQQRLARAELSGDVVDYLGPLANLSGDYARLLDPLLADVVEAAEIAVSEPGRVAHIGGPLARLRTALEEK